MGPFSQRASEPHEQDMKTRLDRDFQLRATFDDEEPQRTLASFDEKPGLKANQREEQAIRNLGFFKEQERQFTQTEDEEEWQERQSPINFVLVIGIFVILCVIGWFGYRWAHQTHTGQPPIIAADPTPFKIRPENPGGMVIPHQDKLVYGRLSADQTQPVEHLLPAPEQLMAPPSPQPHTLVDANGQVYHAYPVPPSHLEAAPQQHYQDPHMAGPNGEYPQEYYEPIHPNAYPTQAPPQMMPPVQQPGMRPLPPMPPQHQQHYQHNPAAAPAPQQQTLQHPSQPGMMPAPALQRPQPRMAPPLQCQAPTAAPLTPFAPAPPPLPPASDKDALEQLIEQEMAVSGPKSDKMASVQKDSAPPLPTPKAQVNSGAYKLQVATLDSKPAAEKEAKRIRNINPSLFSDKKLSTQTVESMGTKKPSYRVIIEGFATPNAAAQFSNKLKTHKVKGIVLHQPT